MKVVGERRPKYMIEPVGFSSNHVNIRTVLVAAAREAKAVT